MNCKSDIVFKLLMKDNLYLLKFIIEYLTQTETCNLREVNAEVLPYHSGKKKIIMDIALRDEDGTLYDIEMQKSKYTPTIIARLQFYISRLFVLQLKKGYDYRYLKPCIQIVFFDDYNKNHLLVDKITKKNTLNTEVLPAYEVSYYIFLKNINEIAEEKGLKNLNLFEKIIYAIENDFKNGILELGDEVINNMYEKVKKVLEGEQLEFYQLALDGAQFEMNAKINEIKQEHKKEMDSKLKEKDIELNETKDELNETKDELNETKDELNETKDELNETKDELNETKSKLDVFVRTVMNLLRCSYDEAMTYVMSQSFNPAR